MNKKKVKLPSQSKALKKKYSQCKWILKTKYKIRKCIKITNTKFFPLAYKIGFHVQDEQKTNY